ncbi:monooxygenase [Rhizobium sp. CG5]|uniref:acyl-CoA dehydrogenase family protein n=1 Tax=Rhizobium sp. CG5 TaxID=2726076 RepID=UPI0020331C7C|nr:acyl-CoA dehydrogenase family protein [Rhizobium sp. CG5]MCM2474967.1 monooxygenase [Rhizobium sp. CG5]
MGTVTHLHERLRTVPTRIGAEDEVLGIARSLVSGGQAGDRSGPSWDDLVQSGLFAISIPVDFGGLDISNAVMAEAVSIIAATSPESATALAGHFSTLEAIRNAGSEEQRRAIFARVACGECFSGLVRGDGPVSERGLRLSTEGIGYCLDGEIASSAALSVDWLTLLLADERGEPRFVLVPRHAREIGITPGEPGHHRLSFQRLHVAADAVLKASADARLMSGATGQLLDGALVLGQSTQTFLSSIQRLRDRRHDADESDLRVIKVEIARAYVKMESLAALINRCGTEIDIAQVTPGARTITRAGQLAKALAIAATQTFVQTADGRSEDALVELGSDLAKETPGPAQSQETDGAVDR